MPKRKRNDHESNSESIDHDLEQTSLLSPENSPNFTDIQIITGSYEKTLHGTIARIASNSSSVDAPYEVEFSDNFLFLAHTSAIRCLALSPLAASSKPHQSERRILASGGTDGRINVYSISTSTRGLVKGRNLGQSGTKATHNVLDSSNRELGSLQHHASSINVLHFPGHSKLLSGADDNTIAISRTRDWTVLSTIKIPIPRLANRPSGDTAGPGETPSGVNDFAVHPSQKLMITVSKGERCMRLWNLVTGKKAGVLNFDKGLLEKVEESKWSKGEGRRVEWSSTGKEFAIAFERDVIIYGLDSESKDIIVPEPRSKIHQIHYVMYRAQDQTPKELLAFSTEDGRVLFYSTIRGNPKHLTSSSDGSIQPSMYRCVGYIGGTRMGVESRIKDFEYVEPSPSLPNSKRGFLVTAGSDGVIRLWSMLDLDLQDSLEGEHANAKNGTLGEVAGNGLYGEKETSKLRAISTTHVGVLVGTYESGSRITCIKAVPLLHVDNQDSAEEFEGFDS